MVKNKVCNIFCSLTAKKSERDFCFGMKQMVALWIMVLSVTTFVFSQTSDEEEKSEYEKRLDIIEFGLASELTTLLNDLTKEKNDEFVTRFSEEFDKNKNSDVKEKILLYFMECDQNLKSDFVLNVLNTLEDQKNSMANLAFKYISHFKIQEAGDRLRELITNEDETFCDIAIRTLGKLGNAEDVTFLKEKFDDTTMTLNMEDALIQAYGDLGSPETYDSLLAVAENEDKSPYLRIQSIEALGKLGQPETVEKLALFYDSADLRIRVATVKALSNFSDSAAQELILGALKDNEVQVRLAAVQACSDQGIQSAVPMLLYRAKNDSDHNLRYRCYDALAKLGSDDGLNFLKKTVSNTKLNDTQRVKAAEALLTHNFSAGASTVIDATLATLKEDRRKNLRYSLGKALAKHENAALEDICRQFVTHSDVATSVIGLDMYSKNRFASVRGELEKMAAKERPSGADKKAKSILEREKGN